MNNGYVGIDCLALPEKFSGAANYIYYLARNILELPRDYALAVFCKSQHRGLFDPFLGRGDKIIAAPMRNRAEQLAFYEFKLKKILQKEKVRIFHANHYLCPPPGRDYFVVNTFHDMGFLLFPRYYPLIKRLYFGRRMKTFLERSNRIIAVSQSTASSIARIFPDFSSKIRTIYPGADHLLSHHSKAPLEPAAASPFILAVNTFEVRKNIPFIIRVFNTLKTNFRIPHRLLLIGHPANGYQKIMAEIKRSPFRPDIVVLNSISSAELNYYYRHCDFFINASVYEGFGFTPFEAINQNCPVFLYRNITVNEFLGDHPYILGHFNVHAWADFIGKELGNCFAGKIKPEAIQHLSWRNAAEQTLRVWDQFVSTKEVNLVS